MAARLDLSDFTCGPRGMKNSRGFGIEEREFWNAGFLGISASDFAIMSGNVAQRRNSSGVCNV